MDVEMALGKQLAGLFRCRPSRHSLAHGIRDRAASVEYLSAVLDIGAGQGVALRVGVGYWFRPFWLGSESLGIGGGIRHHPGSHRANRHLPSSACAPS